MRRASDTRRGVRNSSLAKRQATDPLVTKRRIRSHPRFLAPFSQDVSRFLNVTVAPLCISVATGFESNAAEEDIKSTATAVNHTF